MRRCQKIGLGCLIGGALALASLPYWIGAPGIWIAGRFHTRIGAYERLGYSRFALDDVEVRAGRTRVTVRRAESDTPVVWLWRRLLGKRPVAMAQGWEVSVAADGPARPPGAHPVDGIDPLSGLLTRVARGLDLWLPSAAVLDGGVHWPGGGLRIARADWSSDRFRAQGVVWPGGAPVSGEVDFISGGPILVRADEPAQALRAAVSWTGNRVAGRLWLWAQPIDCQGRFAAHGWLPTEARAEAPAWNLPAARVGMGAAYEAWRGSGRAEWRVDRYDADIDATATPIGKGSQPPLMVKAHLSGDRAGWTLSALHIDLPYAKADLSGAIGFTYHSRPVFSEAKLRFTADLSKLPEPASGVIAGALQASGGVGRASRVDFTVEGAGLTWRGFTARTLHAAGAFEGHVLTVSGLAADGEGRAPGGAYHIEAMGAYDFGGGGFSGVHVEGRAGGDLFTGWMPAGVGAKAVRLEATASGRWPQISHSGEIGVEDLRLPHLKPLTASLSWRGLGGVIGFFDARLAAGSTSLVATGSGDRGGIRLNGLRFAPGGSEALVLRAPAEIRWLPSLRVAGVRLAGPGSSASVDMTDGPGGSVDADLHGVHSNWIRDLFDWEGPESVLDSLTLTGHYAGRRLVFRLTAGATLTAGSDAARLAVAASSDGIGVRIEEARILQNGRVLGELEGRLPVWWDGGRDAGWGVDPDSPFELHAVSAPDSPVWGALGRMLGLVIDGPSAHASLKGTLRHPVGDLEASMTRLVPEAGRVSVRIPPMEGVTVRLRAEEGALFLDRLGGRIAGQGIEASGRFPMNAAKWRSLAGRTGVLDWRDGEGKLEIVEGDLATLAPYIPGDPLARGRLGLSVTLSHGNMSGSFKIRDGATVPIASLGRFQSINADILLENRSARIETASAELGGQAIRAEGRLSWPAGGERAFELGLKGSNVPVVRQAGMLVRADLNLEVRERGRAGVVVGGSVSVRDGIVLGDLTDLLPTGVAGGARPPPYFSVDAAPFSQWGLSVDFNADRSLRVRTALFNGTASAGIHLFGTLGDPRAIGQIQINQGQVTLPFANFDVQTGVVRLSSDDPYHPKIDVTATARQYDYDVRMAVTGEANAPTITFTSNPAVPSDQILLMVMAGQVPSNGGALGGTPSQAAGLGAYFGQNLFQGLTGSRGSNRLDVMSGQQISEKGKATYEIDYRFAHRWWLVGEYDQFDEYNAGVKWRAFSARGTGDEP